MTVTPPELWLAEQAYREAARYAEHARSVRAELITRALEEGWAHAQIAKVTGLSRQRIYQMAPGSPPDPALVERDAEIDNLLAAREAAGA